MINKNVLNLRLLALKVFSEIMSHCHKTTVVTDQIKKTRLGLQNISIDYVQGLSKLYCSSYFDANGNEATLTQAERLQTLKTLQDFSQISKTVRLSNIFLTAFAEVVQSAEMSAGPREDVLLKLDVLIAMMDKVKLKKENYIALMRGVKLLVNDKQTQKKGYQILSKVIERYEIEKVDELSQIRTEITPMMKG